MSFAGVAKTSEGVMYIMYEMAFISTFPPRKCGIATFTADVVKYIMWAGEWRCRVIAIDDDAEPYKYGDNVWFRINQFDKEDYIAAARRINDSSVDAVMIEHEYGIFGGQDGQYILELARLIDRPFAVTCHTILPNPTSIQRGILKQLCEMASGVVVMTQRSALLLQNVYGVKGYKIEIIPHGIPIFRAASSDDIKRRYGLSARRIVSTFGLIGPGKGLEYAIQAMDYVAERFPDALYLILGQTHPTLKRSEGEGYRESLVALVERLNIKKHVRFVNKFLTLRELSDYLAATDVYITPYPGKDQAASGALSYALGAGKAIVSTPYMYARDLLGSDRGMLVPFNDARAMAKAICKLLADNGLRHRLELKAKVYGRRMQWPVVGKRYGQFMSDIISAGQMGLMSKEA